MRHNNIAVAGINIHWVEAGEPSHQPPLILLHGLNDSHLGWTPVLRAMAKDRLILMPDLPGHGLSERPDASYALAWYGEMMAAWLHQVGIERADLAGHSLGGGVGLMMLLHCRERIRRMMLISSGGLGREITPALRLASVPFVIERFGQPFMELGARLALRFIRKDLPAHEAAALAAMNAQAGSARAFSRTVRDLIDWQGQRHNFQRRMDEVKPLPPMLVIWGEDDRVIPATHGHDLAAVLPGVEVKIMPGCGHFPHLDNPEQFSKMLYDFTTEPA